MLKFDIQQTF